MTGENEVADVWRRVADITAPAKDVLRERLERVIVHTLRTFPSLRYFQGYHDVT